MSERLAALCLSVEEAQNPVEEHADAILCQEEAPASADNFEDLLAGL